jgi:hypothetical protein
MSDYPSCDTMLRYGTPRMKFQTLLAQERGVEITTSGRFVLWGACYRDRRGRRCERRLDRHARLRDG